ncbi:MAG: ABC transporter permease subunit [Deltaproteobacteria bacterium]|nr:ABC transporter permease subunit [Deltaproteobacteria bacterium]
MSYVHALLVLLPLMALVATGQVVNKSREDGTLEILFSQPISRGAYFSAISSIRFLVLLAPLAVLMVAVGLFGRIAFGQQVAWSFIGHCIVLCAILIWSFSGLGLWVSTTVQNTARATMYLLLIWVAGIAFMDFALAGMMLQWRLEPRVVFAWSRGSCLRWRRSTQSRAFAWRYCRPRIPSSACSVPSVFTWLTESEVPDSTCGVWLGRWCSGHSRG